jgi:hypothetical protein
MADFFRVWILPCTGFLYTKVLVTRWCFFDLWSFVHFGTGGLLMAVLQRRRLPRPFGLLLVLLVGYEFVEIALTALAVLFLPEILPDQVTDVAVGMAGGVFAWIADRHAAVAGGPRSSPLRDACVAAGLALLWVGLYGYRYDISALNSRFVSWWALLLWGGALLIVFQSYDAIRPSFSHPTMALSVVWPLFTCALFAGEYLSHAILGIRELHAATPTAFGLIDGTPLLKFVYGAAPPLAIGARALLRTVVPASEPGGVLRELTD